MLYEYYVFKQTWGDFWAADFISSTAPSQSSTKSLASPLCKKLQQEQGTPQLSYCNHVLVPLHNTTIKKLRDKLLADCSQTVLLKVKNKTKGQWCS